MLKKLQKKLKKLQKELKKLQEKIESLLFVVFTIFPGKRNPSRKSSTYLVGHTAEPKIEEPNAPAIVVEIPIGAELYRIRNVADTSL